MGHTRLGQIPKTAKWAALVARAFPSPEETPPTSLANSVADIASDALAAAEAGLQRAVADEGLQYTFYLLSRLVLAARQEDWHEKLAQIGMKLDADSAVFHLVASFQDQIDEHLTRPRKHTDISDMAQSAAGEAIAALAGPRADTLFGTGSQEVQAAVRSLSTKRGFSELGQQFFASFMARFLNFYLSRITSAQVGGHRLPQVGELSQFERDLRTHCLQSARIVRDFCGSWYSKTEFQEGISLENTSRFMAVAMRKLGDELRQQQVER